MNKLNITLGLSCWSELIKTISPDHGLDIYMCTFDEVLVQPIGSFLGDNSRRPFPLSLAENVEKVKVTLWSRLMINKVFPYANNFT